LGKVAPPFTSRVGHLKLTPAQKILVPAAGRGHEAAFLASSKVQVVAADFSIEAQREFLKTYPGSAARYEIRDAFEILEENPQGFDGLAEHTFYCAIPPQDRVRYWKAAAQGLKSGGILFGLFWLRTYSGGPPFGATQWEIREFSRANFEIVKWEIPKDSIDSRLGEELWVELRRK
jgi:methyl halide transferase